VAFERGTEVVAAAVLRGDGAGVALTLPAGRWRDVLDGGEHAGGRAELAELAGEHGIALLERA
jgi:(1->4)-alpha-D-glucan 1-alpha-D-glucosylmutase